MHTERVPSTDGVTVVLHHLGGEGPTILFSHATGMHARVWQPVADHLTSDFRCVAVDLRGHGDSEVPDDMTYEWTGMADDVLAVGALLDTPVLAVGWSMGGAALAMAEMRRPGLLRAAFLFEPILFPETPARDRNPFADGARRRREVFADRDELAERLAGRPPFDTVTSAALRAYVDHGVVDLPDGTVRLKCRGETEARVFENHFTGALGTIDAYLPPTQVAMSGDGGRPAGLAPQVAELMPNGALLRLDDVSHFGPMENPQLIAEAIANFFSSVD